MLSLIGLQPFIIMPALKAQNEHIATEYRAEKHLFMSL